MGGHTILHDWPTLGKGKNAGAYLSYEAPPLSSMSGLAVFLGHYADSVRDGHGLGLYRLTATALVVGRACNGSFLLGVIGVHCHQYP